ncbi:MAG TPA: CHAP domain-containing protein, partial [Ktedonobacteraceae bacterium]|nr:CHAP domain-containing protein [Ktedonobacteraceae bacterium]
MKQTLTAKDHYWRRLAQVPIITLASLLVVGTAVVPHVGADQFDDQIRALQQLNAQNQDSLGQLQLQAASYQEVVNQLQTQIAQLQGLINDNLAKQADLQAKIDQNEQELARQRKVLGENIKTMYVDGQMTTIEMLATSKNLSDFVDKEEYHTAVENKIQDTLHKISDLQNQLKTQKIQVERLLADQQAQQAQLDANRAQQAKLLAYNQAQQADFNNQIKSNQSKIADLRRQQAILNSKNDIGSAVPGDPGHGGYPNAWNSAPQDSMVDPWGMYNRECVSYTAYRVHQDYLLGKNTYDMPYWGGVGNANQWDDNARAAGIPVDTTPKVGSIAVSNAGTWGHV